MSLLPCKHMLHPLPIHSIEWNPPFIYLRTLGLSQTPDRYCKEALDFIGYNTSMRLFQQLDHYYTRFGPFILNSMSMSFSNDVDGYINVIKRGLLIESINGSKELLTKSWFIDNLQLQLKLQYLKDNKYEHNINMSYSDSSSAFENHIDELISILETDI